MLSVASSGVQTSQVFFTSPIQFRSKLEFLPLIFLVDLCEDRGSWGVQLSKVCVEGNCCHSSHFRAFSHQGRRR